jgi:hypothetical protein
VRLDDTIHLHRCLYRDDLHIDRLVARQPPTSLDLNTGVLHQEPAAAIGMTVSGRLLRYVSHPEGFGSDFPWGKAWWLLRVECRRRHRHHRGPAEWNGSLCHQLVRYVVINGWSVQNAGMILDYTDPESVLRSAFAFMEGAIDDFRAKQEKREREIEGHGPGAIPAPVPQHHAVPGLHMQDCPQCRKAA